MWCGTKSGKIYVFSARTENNREGVRKLTYSTCTPLHVRILVILCLFTFFLMPFYLSLSLLPSLPPSPSLLSFLSPLPLSLPPSFPSLSLSPSLSLLSFLSPLPLSLPPSLPSLSLFLLLSPPSLSLPPSLPL